jgi:tetrahydromethanopterin S-methyltransferase subunit D
MSAHLDFPSDYSALFSLSQKVRIDAKLKSWLEIEFMFSNALVQRQCVGGLVSSFPDHLIFQRWKTRIVNCAMECF